MRDDDLPVWSTEALADFARHPSHTVRHWAWRRLAARRDPSQVLTLVNALQQATEDETIELFECFDDLVATPLGAREREALRALEAAHKTHDGRARFARELLARHDDAEAFARLVDGCRRGHATCSEWALVRTRNPDLARAILRDLGALDDPSRAPLEALDALVLLCAPGTLPRVDEQAIERDVAPPFGGPTLERCGADSVSMLVVHAQRYTRARGLAESMAAQLAQRRSPSDRTFAARWESPEVLRPLADALVGTRWSEAAAWSRKRLDELRRHDDASQSARAYAAWLTQQRKPHALMVQRVVVMALAAVDRALDALKPFDRADLETRAWRTLTAAAIDVPTRLAWATEAWRDPVARVAFERVVAAAFGGDDALLRSRAARLCRQLPGIELPASAAHGTWEDPWVDDVLDCLASHPACLERLARESHAAPKPPALLYEALGRQQHRAVTPLLRDALARLPTLDAGTAESVLDAVVEVRDPSLMPALLDVYEPIQGMAGYALYALALVAPDPEWRSPELLDAIDGYERSLEGAPLERPDRPFVVAFVCNVCGREGRVEVPTCYLREEQAKCRADGWDGITFDRVIVCVSCGTEDRYTLTPGTRWRALMSAEVEGDGISLVIGPLAVEGVTARRASDLLRHFATALEASPKDPEALRKLAVAQATVGRTEEARATLARALGHEPTELRTLVGCHEAALAVGDDALVEQAAQRIVAVLPKDESDEALRKDAAKRAATWLRRVGAVELTWRSGDEELTDTIQLERVTKWERFVALLTERCVRSVVPRAPRPAPGGRLEKAIDGILPLSIELSPLALRPLPRSPELLPRNFHDVGRNDPCPCGSGKKYKKCHLARR